MRYSVKLLPSTLIDLQDAKEWYNNQQKDLGLAFKREVNLTIDYIGEYPNHYQVVFNNLRRVLVL